MEQFKLNYSEKNIPVASKSNYIKRLIVQTENFLKRLRWKVFFFERTAEEVSDNPIDNFGFKSQKTPPKSQHLNGFEEDIFNLIGNVEFKNVRNNFQKNLSRDVAVIKKSQKIIVQADKTDNMYKMDKSDYQKLLHDNITKDYKKSAPLIKHEIDKQAKNISDTLHLSDRMEVYTDTDCFITVKDHKENFRSSPKCRLINPAKTDLGKISKQILSTRITPVLAGGRYISGTLSQEITFPCKIWAVAKKHWH